MQILAIPGALRAASMNRAVAHAAVELAPDGVIVVVHELHDVPLYDGDVEAAGLPDGVVALREAIAAADALLFCTPEYNSSIPGVLKNAIDIGTRPGGSNSFAGKRAAIIGTSPGAHGTVSAQQHLRNVLSAVDLAVLPQPEIAIQYREGQIDADGNVSDERLRKRLQLFLDRFEAWLAA